MTPELSLSGHYLGTGVCKATDRSLRCRIDVLGWDVGTLHLVHGQCVKVQVPEPFMSQDVVCPHVPEALCWVFYHQLWVQTEI